MGATLEVLACQLRQLQSQIETLLGGSVWNHAELTAADCATIVTRLDDARYAVNMARIRAEGVLPPKVVPVCANDGMDAAKAWEDRVNKNASDPKPDSGDDPRWQGPEYDKYESDERRGA